MRGWLQGRCGGTGDDGDAFLKTLTALRGYLDSAKQHLKALLGDVDAVSQHVDALEHLLGCESEARAGLTATTAQRALAACAGCHVRREAQLR